jgi:hypothetical protein
MSIIPSQINEIKNKNISDSKKEILLKTLKLLFLEANKLKNNPHYKSNLIDDLMKKYGYIQLFSNYNYIGTNNKNEIFGEEIINLLLRSSGYTKVGLDWIKI